MNNERNLSGNGGSKSDQAVAGERRTGGAITTERLLMLAQASPEQQALVDAILAGRAPVVAKAEIGPATGEQAGEEPFIDKKEVCRRLGIKLRTCDAWMAKGWLIFYKPGRAVRFRWSECQNHLAQTARVCRRSR